MYKLVAIGGKLRGTEYNLEEGENVLGRDDSANINVKIEGVSKKHLKITVHGDAAYLEDLGSSNGTFVNGQLVKKLSVINGDKIALPNIIFQLVLVVEKKVIVTKKVVKQAEDDSKADIEEIPDAPKDPFPKIIWLFKYKVMPIFLELNKEYEWRSILAIVLTLYVVITIGLTIFPVLIDNKKVLLEEIGIRGFHYAADIARLNANHLARKNLDAIDTNFLDRESGVNSYELFDLEGRIVRPLGRLNEYTNDTFSIGAREKATDPKKPLEKYAKDLGDGQIGIAQTIKAHNVKLGIEEAVGIIAIKFAPGSLALEAANNSKAYLESFTTSMLVGIIFYAIIYFLTIKHIDDTKFQIDMVLRGRQKEIQSKYKWPEFNPLIGTINTLLQKYQETLNQDEVSDQSITEEDGKYVEILRNYMQGMGGPCLLLNSEKLLMNINTEAEDITGIRESASVGSSLLDLSRDQGFAATVIELCDQCANTGGIVQQGSYELSGKQFNIFVNTLIGKDSFAKAFLISFVRDR
jgi:hypothetical protein